MQATLIHNPNARSTDAFSTEAIVETLKEIGIDADAPPTASESDLHAALRDPGDLVIAAGGDGTIRGVALELNRLGLKVPLALLPLGTANNIARTLGLTDPPEKLLRGLAKPRPRRFDVGHVHSPLGEVRFLEAFGLGLLARGLSDYDPEAGKSLLRAAQTALNTLSSYEARAWTLKLDGRDLSGRYLLVEVMNTASVGLRMMLAPDADPSDGVFDLVLIEEDDRVGLGSYLANLVAGNLESLPNVTVHRGQKLELLWNGSPLHYDEEVLEAEKTGGDEDAVGGAEDKILAGPLEVSLEVGALELYLPTLS